MDKKFTKRNVLMLIDTMIHTALDTQDFFTKVPETEDTKKKRAVLCGEALSLCRLKDQICRMVDEEQAI